MQRITKMLFLSCLKATELIEKKMHFHLTLSEKLQLKLHKSMCQACKLYENQSHFIDTGISRHIGRLGKEQPVDLEQLKQKIQKVLKDRE
jgi:hypothetical protein